MFRSCNACLDATITHCSRLSHHTSARALYSTVRAEPRRNPSKKSAQQNSLPEEVRRAWTNLGGEAKDEGIQVNIPGDSKNLLARLAKLVQEDKSDAKTVGKNEGHHEADAPSALVQSVDPSKHKVAKGNHIALVRAARSSRRKLARHERKTGNFSKSSTLRAITENTTKTPAELDQLLVSPARRVEGVLDGSNNRSKMTDLAPPTEQRPIARLEHGLDRALFNPGVNWLQDPRSHVYNFSPYLQTVPKVDDFAFSRIERFIRSSADKDLAALARQHKAKYTGSTSSLTGMLSQLYMLISRERPVDTFTLSLSYRNAPRDFTPAQKLPVSTNLYYSDGVYSTDSSSAASGLTEKNILTWMGTMLEKFLTLPENKFETLLRRSPAPPQSEPDSRRDAHRYCQLGKFIMRSQLDCRDPRLPGTGVFDIKTRATVSIRLDMLNHEQNSGYMIHHLHGRQESFEKEYYDLIRSAFLKYSFQARIGNMDGVLVAFHNTERIFGFQYIPLEEMDERLYGNKLAGPLVFEKCAQLLEAINDEITHRFPEQDIACLWEAQPADDVLYVWATPDNRNGHAEGPLVEFQVRARNFLNENPTTVEALFEAIPEKAWTIQYDIRAFEDSKAVRHRYRVALAKQNQFFTLPDGVSIEEMAEIWQQIDYGGIGTAASPQPPFISKLFKAPGKEVQRLRKLAVKGRQETERLALQNVGKEPVVLQSRPVLER